MSGRRWSVVLAALVWSATTAQASVMVRQTPQQLAQQAQLVVRATVLSQEEAVDEALPSRVVRTRLRIENAMKGSVSGEIEVQQLGRLVRGVQSGVPGDATFRIGEEVVVFLHAGTGANTGRWFLLGLGQGKFRVVREGTQTPRLERDVRGAHYTKGSSTQPAPQTLPELERALRPHSGAVR